jgi:site-specific DNA-methyltransferase (adenine-specific)
MNFINEIIHGDVIETLEKIPNDSISACITSPPYAQQRKLYEGISEAAYPDWTMNWMEALKPKLRPNGNVLIVIRTSQRNGQVSDYVLRTRLKLRECGWIECEELIWYKPDGPPLGSLRRPRRCWEQILWFSLSQQPFIDLKTCGKQHSNRVGGFAGSNRFGQGGTSPIHTTQNPDLSSGTSRISDVFIAKVAEIPKGVMHPAMYPTTLATQLVKSFSAVGELVLDPFVGSGQTCLACIQTQRNYLGIDTSEEYVGICRQRISEISPDYSCQIQTSS